MHGPTRLPFNHVTGNHPPHLDPKDLTTMDSTADPNPPPSSEPGVGAFPGEFWAGMNSVYSSSQPNDQPFGIGWDHPVFRGATDHTSHSPQPSQEIYPQPQQGWPQQSTLQQQPMVAEPQPQPQRQPQPQPQPQPQSQSQSQQQQQQQYAIHGQYRMSAFQHQQQPTPSFDTPQGNPHSYHSYPFEPQTYYTNSPIPTHNTFEQPAPTNVQRVNPGQPIPVNTLEQQHPQASFLAPGDLQPGIQGGTPVTFANEFARHSHPSFHSTIDPQFLTAPQQAQQNIYAINPADLERTQNLKAGGNTNVLQPGFQGNRNVNLSQGTTQANGFQPLVPKVEKVAKPRKKKQPSVKKAQPSSKTDLKPIGQQQSLAVNEPSSESDETDESEIDLPPPEPSPLPPSRPDNAEGGIRYDALRAVWSPRNLQPHSPNVRNAMVLFSDLVKGVRDAWKARSEALKAAENQNLEDKIPAIKKDVILQRRLLDIILNTTLEYGHPAFVQRFGEHPIIVSAFYSFLLDRHTAADSDGALTVNILKLMVKFTTMDQAMLEKTKNDKILTRFVKKGGSVIKPLAQAILANAAGTTKKKAMNSKISSKENSSAISVGPRTIKPEKSDVVIHNPSEPISGVKRARELEDNATSSTKRVVSPSNGKVVSRLAATTTTIAKKPPVSHQDGKTTANPGNQINKPKANIVTPKPTPSLFTSLMSASKKPGTSNAARAAAAAAAKDKPSATPEQKDSSRTPAAKPAFSFSETMADLSKPKETTPPKQAEDLPPETEEERKKRLRKEERRKLRVSWKPDDTLTEIRLFTHDPEEEIGHDDSMMRDVDDVAGEGRTLKMHRGFDDFDDDEDGGWNEESIFPYTISAIDFDDLDAEERNRNFLKTGGSQKPDSPEKIAQDQREATTLSVFYSSPSDIPISPKEPPSTSSDEDYNPEVPFGEPHQDVKARSKRYFDARAPPPPPPTTQQSLTPPSNPSPQVDISSLLKVLQQNQQPQSQQQTPQPSVSEPQSTFPQFTDPSRLQQMPQQPQPGQAPALQGLDMQKLLAVMNAQQQMQQATAYPQAQVQASQGPNLATLLSQLSNGAAQQQQQQMPSSYNQQKPYYEDKDRKRTRDGMGGFDGDDSGHSYNKRFRMNGDPNKPKKHPKAGLVPCRYWKEGKCLKGEDCTFRHDPLD